MERRDGCPHDSLTLAYLETSKYLCLTCNEVIGPLIEEVASNPVIPPTGEVQVRVGFCRKCGAQYKMDEPNCPECGNENIRLGKSNSDIKFHSEYKNPSTALIFTILWPGSGHIWIGKREKGYKYVLWNVLVFTLGLTVLYPIALMIYGVTLSNTARTITREARDLNLMNGYSD
jgi:predicted RNA-binding Zn-ribbon protein involved in translation (DUF1610 family)